THRILAYPIAEGHPPEAEFRRHPLAELIGHLDREAHPEQIEVPLWSRLDGDVVSGIGGREIRRHAFDAGERIELRLQRLGDARGGREARVEPGEDRRNPFVDEESPAPGARTRPGDELFGEIEWPAQKMYRRRVEQASAGAEDRRCARDRCER